MALQLRRQGLAAKPLEGGYTAWRKLYPVEPKTDPAVPEGRVAG